MMGCIFGRADAFIRFIECQKAGSLHIHGHLFVQCLHQHTPLWEIIQKLKSENGKVIVDGYLKYKSHVCRQVYASERDVVDARLHVFEGEWPNHKDSVHLISSPDYMSELPYGSSTDELPDNMPHMLEEGEAWLKKHLEDDVEDLQMMRQHHVHLVNPDTGKREPLAACRSKENPNLCKSNYPRNKWLVHEPVVLCAGLLKQMGLHCRGRKCQLGALHGPNGHEFLNATHSAMLAAQRCNSDVQLPYRLPIIDGKTHFCDNPKCLEFKEKDLIEATQVAQDAQAGYACDYCNKRQPLAFNECKECVKGLKQLSERYRDNPLNKLGKRYAMRIMSDAYGKCCVRAAVENTNLRAYARNDDITSAESIKTCQTVSFFGKNYVDVVECLVDRKQTLHSTVFAQIDGRSKRYKKVTFRDVAALYGHRPNQDVDHRVWYLSPYEFVTEWEVVLLNYPQSLHGCNSDVYHASLTDDGMQLLTDTSSKHSRLLAGLHYRVKEGKHDDWIAFPDCSATESFRHTYIIKKRRRPVAPMFIGSPVPLKGVDAERAAMLTMVYFRPWTLRPNDAQDRYVPYAGKLRPDDKTWQEEFDEWLSGNVISEESVRYINNFMCVYRVRPRDVSDDVLSGEDFSDAELELTEQDLERALRTRIGGRESKKSDNTRASATGRMSHEENSRTGIALVQQIWPVATDVKWKGSKFAAISSADMKKSFIAARKSQRQVQDVAVAGSVSGYGSNLQLYERCDEGKINKWLKDVKIRRVDGRRVLNKTQFRVVKKVAKRICLEYRALSGGISFEEIGEPLRWLVHGGPGTGKTHVIKIIKEELFAKVLGWNIGMEYNIIALQAVMADLLGGDTIHHALNIGIFGKQWKKNKGSQETRATETMKSMLMLRWLIIDEISMVSARLLADIDYQLRHFYRHNSEFAHNQKKVLRPFAGVNILFSGDFWQLPPPEGGFLGDIPFEYIRNSRQYMPAPSISHGQSLVWSGPETGIQGVTELQKCERTDDVWLQSVQEEFRFGKLTVDTHAFLHGKPTLVPGSCIDGVAKCQTPWCVARASVFAQLEKTAPPQGSAREMCAAATLEGECEVCKKERKSRMLVAQGAKDPRFMEDKFLKAPAVVPNNDMKYDLNKTRALGYANKKKIGVMYCIAKDSPSHEALRIRPDLPSQKIAWLSRHDRESGDLYGVLPLMKGMPVAMSDHIDRSEDKRLLRGRVGWVHSWVLADDERSVFENGKQVLKKLPKVVYVEFFEKDGSRCSWKIDGMKQCGVYPIIKTTREWYLDKGTKHPQLQIKRRQIPLTPAFGMTSHSAQGQTFSKGAAVDLCIGGSSSTMSSYVALTRVERRQDLLILRPFPLDLFTKGQKPGMELLLRTLRGDKSIDWKAIEKELMPSKLCPTCGSVKLKTSFTETEFKRLDEKNQLVGSCKLCQAEKKAEGIPLQCTYCFTYRAETDFPQKERHWRASSKRVCCWCDPRKVCSVCEKLRDRQYFSDREWLRIKTNTPDGTCIECMPLPRCANGSKRCRICKKEKLHEEFTMWGIARYRTKRQACDTCMQQE